MVFILELIGTVAFAFSGCMVANSKKMDIFGVWVLGTVTAVGGAQSGMYNSVFSHPTCFVTVPMWQWRH